MRASFSQWAADTVSVNAPRVERGGLSRRSSLENTSGVESGMKLYVGNLHSEITEEQLRGVFSPFGSPKRKKAARRKPRDGRRRRCPHLHVGFLERIDIHREQATGEARYGFLHFALAADGKRCMDQMDQMD